jgi:ketosteroid isomerase-like protein
MEKEMDDLHAINAAKSEFRDAFNLGDTDRLLAITDPDFVGFADGQPSEFGESGLVALKARLEDLFEHFAAKLAVIIVEIRRKGDVAYEYGWHDLTLAPKDSRPSVRRRDRYVDVWRKNKEGCWKLWMYIDNRDVADPFCPGKSPTEQHETTGAS